MEMEKASLKGKVIWFFGISGAGKTTLADMLAKKLKEKQLKVERLDGDEIRQVLCKDLGFSRKDVYENIRRVGYMADILSRNYITVIASFVTPHETNRILLKTILGNRLILIRVMTSPEECMKRDTKGLWLSALHGDIKNLAGWDTPFEPVRDYSSCLTIDLPTSNFGARDTYNDLINALEFWGYDV